MTENRFYDHILSWTDPNRINIKYFYLLWISKDSDIQKDNSVFIGYTEKTNKFEVDDWCGVGGGITKVLYNTNINANIKWYCLYKNGHDYIGESFISEYKKSKIPFINPLNTYHYGSYVTEKLAKDKLFQEFWLDNKDWLSKI